MKQLLNTLYVTIPDVYLSLDGETVVLLKESVKIGKVPLHNIERIMVFGYLGVSPALMGKCVAEHIELVFLKPTGQFLARVEGGVSGNVHLRKEQFIQSLDENKSLNIAKSMIGAKIYNSRQILKRTIRDHSMRIDVDLFENKSRFLLDNLANSQSIEDIDSLRGVEGESASIYFSVFDEMILQQKDKFQFTKRSKRPPLDNVNALLSFAYALCTSMCASALESVGLDPYVGFMHTDRPGRKSLALDMVEEFRGWMCDRFVLMLINKKIIVDKHFENAEDGAVLLNDEGRKIFLEQWQKRKTEVIQHPYLKEKVEWGLLPYVQALLLSRYLRGDLDAYPAFMWK